MTMTSAQGERPRLGPQGCLHREVLVERRDGDVLYLVCRYCRDVLKQLAAAGYGGQAQR